jgi:TonB-dependent SusC/RagA subfamily outer membrane receptor
MTHKNFNRLPMKKIITLIAGFLFIVSIHAQNRVIHGKLTVFNTYPVRNVEVFAKKAKTSTMTDSLGRFSIVCNDNDIIRIKPKAFKPVNKRITPKTDSLNINLYFIDNKTNREIATGYGYINKNDLLYGVNHLQQENNDFCNYANIFDLIKGRFSGVTVSNGRVYIRGSSSFTGQTQAVFIVNGVEVQSIDWITPCQVASIDILKDTAAAIYGTRGGNGVVVIQTKKSN